MQIEEVQQKKLDLAKMIRDQVIEFENIAGNRTSNLNPGIFEQVYDVVFQAFKEV